MALHKTGVNVPVTFEFAPAQRHWFICSAEILGWSEVLWRQKDQEQRTLGGLAALRIDIPAIHDATRGSTLMHDDVKIQVHVAIPASSTPYMSEVTVSRAEIPNLPSDWTPENHPDLHLPRFPMLVSPIPGTISAAKETLHDPGEMRRGFFALETGDNYQLATFLSKWGLWGGEHTLRKEGDDLRLLIPREPGVLALSPQSIWSLHSAALSGAAGSPKQWFTQALPNHMGAVTTSLFAGASVRHKYPYFVVRHSLCRDAIVDAITIDQLRGIKHRFCKNKKCARLYEKTNNHKSEYCSTKCGTAVRVGRFRRKPKK